MLKSFESVGQMSRSWNRNARLDSGGVHTNTAAFGTTIGPGGNVNDISATWFQVMESTDH